MTKFFNLEATSGKARACTLKTAHGEIQTPIFMPVGTRATVKTMTNWDLDKIGAQIILGNTYHLYLRPGHKLIEKLGGLHQFMNYQKPILTDSGGFQVFSLSDLNKVTETGVHFKSHLDGSKHFIGPNESMEIQKALGSDIVMVFDECPSLPSTKEKLQAAVDKTLSWAKICKDYKLQDHQHLFGIIQGGLDFDMRTKCMNELEKMDFPGLAIGGLSVGEKNQEMKDFLEDFVFTMPSTKPRYLMGVGTPLDILDGIKSGLDMFDCVLPTRNARNGQVLTHKGPINIKNEKFKDDSSSLDELCDCNVCQNHSKAYLRHLYSVGEYLSGQLISYHNLYFYLKMVKEARAAILKDSFDEYYQSFYNTYTQK